MMTERPATARCAYPSAALRVRGHTRHGSVRAHRGKTGWMAAWILANCDTGPAAEWPRWNAVAVTMKQRGPSPKPARLTFAQQLQTQARTARVPGSGWFRRALDHEEKAVERALQQAALLPASEVA